MILLPYLRGRISRPLWERCRRCLSTKVSYSHTLNLPKSQFPMKHSRMLELQVEQATQFGDLYRRKFDQLDKCGSYILHDGPPYANGNVHFGHAINKILKDIIIKRQLVENKQVHYVPGWDCHGLPIELKAISEDEATKVAPEEIRRRARQLAYKAIDDQRNSFEQWFLSGDFRNPYLTLKPEFIGNQLRAFYKLYQNGLIFRDYMPVYWSPSTRTALAEAELQYNHQHISESAFVKYELVKDDLFTSLFSSESAESPRVNVLIWTTTPWTLLANEAIAIGESLQYSLVSFADRFPDERFIVASELVGALQERFKASFQVHQQLEGSNLIGLKYVDSSTLTSKTAQRPLIASSHVSLSKGGTGLVHLAPNHGFDDYKLFQNNPHAPNYKRESIVNEFGELMVNGVMSEPVAIIDDNRASKFVIHNILNDHIVHQDQHEHSYPYDWRSGKPVIIKPSSQWFLRMDSIRSQCLQELSKVNLIPEKMRKEFVHHISTRPNWCLSRQRNWGVPIPVFYHQQDSDRIKPILEPETFQNLLKRFESEGCDFWWQDEASVLVPGSEHLVKGRDILDIWFDSGTSWLSVLGEDKVADLYLEGIDQIRGWFQSSLITSVALRGIAPYKSVLIHGFALDKDGKKMSKSVGNVVDPMDIVNAENGPLKAAKGGHKQKSPANKLKGNTGCGVDGLRFWIARHACTHNDSHVDIEEFQNDVLTSINRIRNTLRFMLAYLGSSEQPNILAQESWNQMPLLDKHMMLRIWKFNERCNTLYKELNLGDVCETAITHVLFELATFYFTRVKDRLYCDHNTSLEHRSALTVLHYAYHSMGYQLAPIIPHIILEANSNVQFDCDQVFQSNFYKTDDELIKNLFPDSAIKSSQEFQDSMNTILRMIDTHINPVANSQNLAQLSARIENFNSEEVFRHLKLFDKKDLKELFQLADFETSDQLNHREATESESEAPEITIKFEKVDSLVQCPRCRLFNVNKTNVDEHGLCCRCSKLI